MALTPVVFANNMGSSLVNSGSSLTTTADAPAGSLLVFIIHANNTNVAVTGVTISSGDAVVQAVQTAQTASEMNCAIYYVSNSAHDLPSGGTITVTTNNGGWRVAAYYVTEANGGLDKINSLVQSTTSNSLSLSTAALSGTNDIAFASINSGSSFATGYTEATGLTNLVSPSGTFTHSVDYEDVSSAPTYNPSWTTKLTFAAAIATFQATATFPITRDSNVAVESNTAVFADARGVLEWNVSLFSDAKTPTESSQCLSFDRAAPPEWRAALLADEDAPAECGVKVLSGVSAVIESGGGMRGDAGVPVDRAQGVLADRSAPMQAPTALEADGSAPLESLGAATTSIAIDAAGLVEWAAALEADAAALPEWDVAVCLDSQTRMEALGLVIADSTARAESLSNLIARGLVPIEWITPLLANGRTNAEFRTAIITDSPARLEALVAIAADRDEPFEWVAGSTAANDVAQVEWIVGVQTNALGVTEFVALIETDRRAPTDGLTRIFSDVATLVEWLALPRLRRAVIFMRGLGGNGY